MKNYIATTIAATALIVFIFGMESTAQIQNRVIATIPFEFSLGDEKLPAGQYEFRSLTPQAYPGNVIVRSLDRPEEQSVIVPAMASDALKAGEGAGLVFNRYGTSHFLSRIQLRGTPCLFDLEERLRNVDWRGRINDQLRL